MHIKDNQGAEDKCSINTIMIISGIQNIHRVYNTVSRIT